MTQVRITDSPADVASFLATMLQHVNEIPYGPGLAESLERIVRDPSYRFVLADDGHGGSPLAAGVVTFLFQPMAEVHVLAVEALWFLEGNLGAQLPIWRALTDLARRMDFGGVCVAARSTNGANALRQLIDRGELDDDPITVSQLPLQKQNNPAAVRTALSDEMITDSAFISVPVAVIHTRKVQVDLSGREYEVAGPLYRGEGRVQNPPHWRCRNVDELAALHFAQGFYARPRELPSGSTAPFSGTIAEQLLHQGYIGQGAVSLSTSFDVAAAYATHTHERDEALVFVVDSERLRQRTRIFDARATLASGCPLIPGDAWTPLRRVVLALSPDLEAAGAFLERCHAETFERARVGLGSLAPRPDPMSYLSARSCAALERAGVSNQELLQVHDAFEEFAIHALQQIGSVDTLRPRGQGNYAVETRRPGPMVYFEVFARILGPLKAALGGAAAPGWDTTPMGYIAKTVRDDECFAAGPLPGALIVEAYVVGRDGRRCRRIVPT
jgi:hypothetical protein